MSTDWNDTRKQHYVSQVEQRLNSIDDVDAIYNFEVVDARSCSIRLKAPKGAAIGDNLMGKDMFSLSVAEGKRLNLEGVWKTYEDRYRQHVDTLRSQLLSDLGSSSSGTEVLGIISLKVLGMLRNPYFGRLISDYGLRSHHALSEELREDLERISSLSLPASCRRFGFTLDEYKAWVTCLRVVFHRLDDGSTIFDLWLAQMLSSGAAGGRIYTYSSEHSCLLGDRPCFEVGTGCLFLNCNISRHMFLSFIVMSPANLPVGFSEIPRQLRKVQFFHAHDDLEALAKFNQAIVRYSSRFVFSGSKTPHGVHVL